MAIVQHQTTMQITLSSQQSQILQSLAQQGGYVSLEDAIDTALVLLADEIVQQNSDQTPEYLAWVEQTRLKIEQGIQAAERGDVLDVNEVLTRLRSKVEAARSTSL
jgi:antitoxin ParD1/3/4